MIKRYERYENNRGSESFVIHGDWVDRDEKRDDLEKGWFRPCFYCNDLTAREIVWKEYTLYSCKDCITKSEFSSDKGREKVIKIAKEIAREEEEEREIERRKSENKKRKRYSESENSRDRDRGEYECGYDLADMVVFGTRTQSSFYNTFTPTFTNTM